MTIREIPCGHGQTLYKILGPEIFYDYIVYFFWVTVTAGLSEPLNEDGPRRPVLVSGSTAYFSLG